MKDGTWYDEDYFTSHDKSSGYNPDHPYTWEYRWPFAHAMVRDLLAYCMPFKTVLEVGCATGILVKVLRQWGFEAWGVDLSEWAIANAEEEAKPYVQVGNVNKLPFGDRNFDLVIGLDILEHVPHDLGRFALEEMMRVSNREVLFRVAALRDEQWITNPNPLGWRVETGDESHVNIIRAREWEDYIRQLGWMHISTHWGADLDHLDYLVGFVGRRPEFKHGKRGLDFNPKWKL
jgi:hypothetical protein